MSPPPYTTDTSRDARDVQLRLLRRMPPAERARKVFALSDQLKEMALDAIRRRSISNEDDVKLRFIELTYGDALAGHVRRWRERDVKLSEGGDLVAALAPVVGVLRTLGIRHYVGGSVASSFHGATRSTMDVDLVCELVEESIRPFIAALGNDFYVSGSAVREAVQRKSCFNLIHYPSSYKVDLFISRGRRFDIESMERAEIGRLGTAVFVDVPIATAEDSIISKLEWYRLTNETSERQWEDVSRLLLLLDEQADREYLKRAADSVGVSDLLERLLASQD